MNGFKLHRVFLFLLFISLMLSLPVGAKRVTKGFRVQKMQLKYPYQSDWEGRENGDVLAILNQPFYYLDRGAQCYVFESKDQQYVIKLFRYDQPQTPVRSFYRSHFTKRKRKTPFETKIIRLFGACKMAFELVPEETGLIYIHLNPTADNLPILQCRDSVGRKYSFPLDQYRFVIQKKVQGFRNTLEKARQNREEMKRCLDAVITLLTTRTAMGISNSDSNLSRNFGFLDGRAIEIDFGNYFYTATLFNPTTRIFEIKRYTDQLRKWLKKNAPEWTSYLDEKMRVLEGEM